MKNEYMNDDMSYTVGDCKYRVLDKVQAYYNYKPCTFFKIYELQDDAYVLVYSGRAFGHKKLKDMTCIQAYLRSLEEDYDCYH